MGGGEGQASPIISEGGGPIIHPPFPFFYVKQGKNHKCTKLKGKIIINVTLI